MVSGVFREQRGDPPRFRNGESKGMQRVVCGVPGAGGGQRREATLETAVDHVRPLSLDADERCADRLAEE